MIRIFLLLLVASVAGCGSDAPSAPAPVAPTKTAPLPPEVEHDPATAAKQYQKGKPARR